MTGPKRRRAPRRRRSERQRQQVQEVVDETIALFRWLQWVAEQLYDEEAQGVARRWVLRRLARDGPQTVPQLARTRQMRRQSMQPVLDALAADGLVEWRDNPAHARSRLAAITRRGKRLVDRLDAVDARVLHAVGRDVARTDLECTARTLRALREAFELEPRWRRVLD